MIELVLTVCLAVAPTQCREERPTFAGSAMSCLTEGQMVAARWLADHPSYTLTGWRCEVNRPREERI